MGARRLSSGRGGVGRGMHPLGVSGCAGVLLSLSGRGGGRRLGSMTSAMHGVCLCYWGKLYYHHDLQCDNSYKAQWLAILRPKWLLITAGGCNAFYLLHKCLNLN